MHILGIGIIYSIFIILNFGRHFEEGSIPGGDSSVKMTGCSSYLLAFNICRLVPFRVL